MSMQGLITGFIVWYLVFLFSTTLHEAAHSFLSAYGGDRTAHSATVEPRAMMPMLRPARAKKGR